MNFGESFKEIRIKTSGAVINLVHGGQGSQPRCWCSGENRALSTAPMMCLGYGATMPANWKASPWIAGIFCRRRHLSRSPGRCWIFSAE